MQERVKKDPERGYRVIGTRPIRPDGADKVTGRAKFGADFKMAGQLVGKVLRSPRAPGERRARSAPGCKLVPPFTGAADPPLGVAIS